MTRVVIAVAGGSMSFFRSLVALPTPYQWVTTDSSEVINAALTLQVVDRELRAPFVTLGPREALVSTYLAPDIVRYAGLNLVDYHRALAFCAVLPTRALQLNPCLEPVDLLHGQPINCLLSDGICMEEYPGLFENPLLCASCRRFYAALCPPAEVRAWECQIARLAKAASRRPFAPVRA